VRMIGVPPATSQLHAFIVDFCARRILNIWQSFESRSQAVSAPRPRRRSSLRLLLAGSG
jgi:hypothetical protein